MRNANDQDCCSLLMDRQTIQDCIFKNVLGADTLDAEMWKSTYWPDADEEHAWYNGNAHQFVDETIPSLKKDMDTTWHQIGNVLIEVNGDRASAVSYYFAYCRTVDPSGVRSDLFAGGRYVDRFERRGGIWKIAYRITKSDWIRLAHGSFPWGAKTIHDYAPSLGSRDPDDPARVLFGRTLPGAPVRPPKSISPPW